MPLGPASSGFAAITSITFNLIRILITLFKELRYQFYHQGRLQKIVPKELFYIEFTFGYAFNLLFCRWPYKYVAELAEELIFMSDIILNSNCSMFLCLSPLVFFQVPKRRFGNVSITRTSYPYGYTTPFKLLDAVIIHTHKICTLLLKTIG